MDNINDRIFQVSVKGLFLNEEGKLMMIQEDDGVWEVPGGRIQHGEDLVECLKRECQEEMGLECEVIDSQPTIVYSTTDKLERGRVMIFYKVKFENLDFTPSSECVDIKFFDIEEIQNLKILPQTKKLPEILASNQKEMT